MVQDKDIWSNFLAHRGIYKGICQLMQKIVLPLFVAIGFLHKIENKFISKIVQDKAISAKFLGQRV